MRFIDMYAGVGGFRLGFEREGHECVWSCENDKWCQQVYRRHWEEPEAGDVREVLPETVPDHDLLCAGFPCQSFSLAGKRKGFEDTRGTLFHEIGRIVRTERPPWLLLENVKGLLSAQDRRAFRVVLESLDECGYNVSWQVLNSKNFGVPQNRPRVFVVGHLRADGGRPFEVLPVGGGEGEDSGEDGGSERELSGVETSQAVDKNYHKGADGKRQLVAEGGEKVKSALMHSQGLETKDEDVLHALKGAEGGWSKNFVVLDDTEVGVEPKEKGEVPSLRGNSHGNRAKIIQKSPDWREDGTLRDFASHSPAIRKEMGDNLPMILHNIYGGFNEDEPREFDKVSPAIRTPKGGGHIPSVASAVDPNGYLRDTGHHDTPLNRYRIRKLTPVECERLQGFPDGWTKLGIDENGGEVEISDTQRYKMMGNAVTVNVVEFIAERFNQMLEGGR